MKKGQNYNHPQKGSSTIVEPIREIKHIKLVKLLLADRPRDLCLFTVGINTNLRPIDLLALTVGDVRNVRPMREFRIREIKTKKPRDLTLNRQCVESIAGLLKIHPDPFDNAPLFFAQRGGGAIGVPVVSRMVKRWCTDIELRGNYAGHTLRKTFGYHQRVRFGVGLPELMVAYNHSTQRQTLTYLCIQEDEVKSMFANEI
jgi:integrase